MPLPDASVDCVISNCVINLAPDKPAVFREIARVLKPGGRLAVSDIALKRPLPPEIGNDLMAYVGCVAGAILIEDYRNWLAAAGFTRDRDHRHRQGLERVFESIRPVGLLRTAHEQRSPGRLVLLQRGAQRTGRLAGPIQRQRLRRQRESVRG